jgi:hypothetical protein
MYVQIEINSRLFHSRLLATAKKNHGFSKPIKNLCSICPKAIYSSSTKAQKGFPGFNVLMFLSGNKKTIQLKHVQEFMCSEVMLHMIVTRDHTSQV